MSGQATDRPDVAISVFSTVRWRRARRDQISVTTTSRYILNGRTRAQISPRCRNGRHAADAGRSKGADAQTAGRAAGGGRSRPPIRFAAVSTAGCELAAWVASVKVPGARGQLEVALRQQRWQGKVPAWQHAYTAGNDNADDAAALNAGIRIMQLRIPARTHRGRSPDR